MFQPLRTLTEQDVNKGLRMMTLEGTVSLGFFSITTTGFLAAYALALGANNLQIGLLAAAPFLTRLLQIPSILLVERIRRRKAIAVLTWFPAQLLWIPAALIPVFIDVPGGVAISLLLGVVTLRGVLVAIVDTAWQGWVRDLVPQAVLGRFYSRRLAYATITAAVFGISAAVFVDVWKSQTSVDSQVLGYTIALLFGTLFLGLLSPIFMARMPEPLMLNSVDPTRSLTRSLLTPFKDKNFRQLLKFLFLWGLALNLAVPFFAVYMLKTIGLSLTWVMALNVLGQISLVLFLRVWGPMADKFGSKVTLGLSASLYLLVVIGWTFTTLPDRYFLTIPLLVTLHIFAGIAAAGVTLTTGTVGLKLAPQGEATSYLAAAGLATSIGVGLGPVLGGVFADYFSVRELNLTFAFTEPGRVLDFSPLNLTGFDFLFAIAFVIGFFTLNLLTAFHEEGEADRKEVMEELFAQGRGFGAAAGSVPGVGLVSQYPYSYLRRVPGLDVALGVTAYQIADATRAAMSLTARAQRTVGEITQQVSHAITGTTGEIGHTVVGSTTDLARHAARGALLGGGHTLGLLGMITRGTILGVVRGLEMRQAAAQDTMRGAAYGAIEGMIEADENPAGIVAPTIEAAIEAAEQMGLTEGEAAMEAARGMLQAMQALAPDSIEDVKRELPEVLREANVEVEPGAKPDEHPEGQQA